MESTLAEKSQQLTNKFHKPDDKLLELPLDITEQMQQSWQAASMPV